MVIYVSAPMRSGTTLLGQAIASSPDAVFVGEVRATLADIHRYSSCDCGATARECRVWGPVYERAARLPTGATKGSYSLRAAPRLLMAFARPSLLSRTDMEIVDILRSLHQSVSRGTKRRLIVDSSKSPTTVLLWRHAGVPVHLVQCVRSPREVSAAQAAPEAVTGVLSVPRRLSLAAWVAYNLSALFVAPLCASFNLVRFRRMLANPAVPLRRVWASSDVSAGQSVEGSSRAFRFTESHVLAANPRRSQSGVVTFRAADGKN